MNLSFEKILFTFIIAAAVYILGSLIFPAFAITGLTSQQFASILGGIGFVFGLFSGEEIDELNIEKDNKKGDH